MGRPDTANKLTEEHKGQLVALLAEGCSNAEVNERLEQLCGETLHRNTITYYRQQYADQIDAARQEALARVAQQGFANKVRAIRALCRKAEKLDETLDKAAVGSDKWERLCAELRALRRDIRDELGDLVERREVVQRRSGLEDLSEEELDELLEREECEDDD